MSSLLFVIIMEAFNSIISALLDRSLLEGFLMGTWSEGDLSISHLLFSYGTLIISYNIPRLSFGRYIKEKPIWEGIMKRERRLAGCKEYIYQRGRVTYDKNYQLCKLILCLYWRSLDFGLLNTPQWFPWRMQKIEKLALCQSSMI